MERVVKVPFSSRMKEYINARLASSLLNLSFPHFYTASSKLFWLASNQLLIKELKVFLYLYRSSMLSKIFRPLWRPVYQPRRMIDVCLERLRKKTTVFSRKPF